MAGNQNVPFTTPAGRIVQGNPYDLSTTDMEGNLRVVKSGPKAGQPSPQQFIAVAFPKLINGQPNQEFAAWYKLVEDAARQSWPGLFPNGGPCVSPTFSMKVKDGDGFAKNGNPLSDRPGFGGHWIVSFTRNVAEVGPCRTAVYANGAFVDTTADKPIKCGHWVRVSGSTRSNDSVAQPGMYMNLDLVEFIGFDPAGEISQGADPSKAFGDRNFALPAGISTTPVAGAPAAPLGAALGAALPSMPGTAAPIAAAPSATTSPSSAPAAAPAPYGGYMPPTGPVRTMTAAAGAFTYEQYVQQGWTDDALVSGGLMTIS